MIQTENQPDDCPKDFCDEQIFTPKTVPGKMLTNLTEKETYKDGNEHDKIGNTHIAG